jgi:hypothetical protein
MVPYSHPHSDTIDNGILLPRRPSGVADQERCVSVVSIYAPVTLIYLHGRLKRPSGVVGGTMRQVEINMPINV